MQKSTLGDVLQTTSFILLSRHLFFFQHRFDWLRVNPAERWCWQMRRSRCTTADSNALVGLCHMLIPRVMPPHRRAKAFAAQAKAAADKGRQKEAGAVIRDLILEMKRLGMSEADAAALAPPPPAAAAASNATGAAAAATPSGTQGVASPHGGGHGASANAPATTTAAEDRGTSAAASAAKGGAPSGDVPDAWDDADSGAESDGSAGALDFSLFDEPAAPEARVPPSDGNVAAGSSSASAADPAAAAASAAPAASAAGGGDAPDWGAIDLFADDYTPEALPVAEPPAGAAKRKDASGGAAAAAAERIAPWGMEASGSGRGAAHRGVPKAKGRDPRDAARDAAAEQRLPRALLSQHCQKMGWHQPRFDKLPDSDAGCYRCDAGQHFPAKPL